MNRRRTVTLSKNDIATIDGSMFQAWECSRCTYRHQAIAPRCVMCQESRVSRAQMRDFILGKGNLPPPIGHPNSASSVAEKCIQNENTDNNVAVAPETIDISVSLPNIFITISNEVPNGTGTSAATENKESEVRPHSGSSSNTAKRHNPYSKPSVAIASQNPPPPQPDSGATNGALHPLSNQTFGTSTMSNAPHTGKMNHSLHATDAVQHEPQNRNIQTINPMLLSTGNTKRPPTSSTVASRKAPVARIQEHRKRPRSLTTQQHQVELPYQPGKVPLSLEHAATWIYPAVAAYPKRQYQYAMAHSAIVQNTLVSLPTGLGKTLIAAVVLYNFYRWFPTGKVIFLAPTLPLVDQQVQACYEIMGIPANDTALLTGKVPAAQRTIIWQEKRVFFCTPQTVQKDLEMNRCDASNIVCVVFDEAHKSTGDYAYCKVVSYLEKAGAKFRVLGLSATPGTSIKAVQQVIDVLRINCIEARSDEDPDVKQYIHERQTEVIVVHGSIATKEVEQILDEIIGPILDVLRNRNVLPQSVGNPSSASTYALLKSQQFIKTQPQHDRDNSALGYLAAGICFLQIRSDLHKHGIGMVRGKLHKLQNDRQRGILSSIVKGKQFLMFWEAVDKISCNPNAVENTVQDKLQNNPKLKKLREILTEHFERSKACSISSRVIVFSQFRTSVSEIVDILNESKPLIRARHFIGQGKGGTKSEKNNVDGQPPNQFMEGMKQDEQKNVIHRFKDGIYNTLVCTSIGEEGLDIGEVDLIVNFDCLSSPIRMIQRVGRTGRKREGRVVTLVAEGQEEKTLAKSRQNERTLIHALKNPKSFVVAPNNPMFPKEPVAVEQSMVFSQRFHMSQLHGVRKRQKKPDKQSWSARNWKLSETEEFQRSCVLGRLPKVRLVATQEAIFSTNVRRRFLVGRVWSCSQTTKSKRSLVSHGRLSELLRTIETSYSIKRNKIKTGSFRKSAEAVLDIVFPLSNASPVTVAESFINSKNESVSMASTDTSDIHMKKASDSNIPNVTISKIHHPGLGVNIACDSTEISPRPVQRSFGHLTNNDKLGKMISSQLDGLPLIEYPTPSMKSKPVEPILNVDEFRLPSQSDSSSYESDADLRVDNAPVVGNDATAEDAFCLPTPSSDEENDVIDSDHRGNDVAIEKSTNVEIPIDDVFCLPTPESSSDEEQSIDDDLNRCSRNTILLDDENSLDSPIVHEVNRMKSVGSLPVGTSEPAILQSNAQVAKFSPSTKRSGGRVRFSLESSVGQDVLSNLETSQDFVPGNRKNQNKRIIAIEDTPESVAVTRSAVETKLDYELHDTQEVNDIDQCICAICLTNDLQEDNPIILCDGSSLGAQCNLMVHIQCYSINFNWKDDKEWRCDQCEYLFGGGSSTNLKCLLCDRRNGILKLSTDGLWKHIKCDMVLTTQRDSLIRLRRLPRTESQKYPHVGSRRRPLADISPKNQESPTALALQKKRRRLLVMQQFMDYEADASDIDDDDEQEELEIRAIEEEEDELARDFINDSSQLGFAYDDLDRVDPVRRLEDITTTSHRALDMERERKLEFATPVLSRRIRQRQLLMNSSDNTEDDDRSDTVQATGCTAPDSSRGLGNMHFIRSVLDHHRNGGSAEEIEELYNELEKQANDENEADENTTVVAFSNKW